MIGYNNDHYNDNDNDNDNENYKDHDKDNDNDHDNDRDYGLKSSIGGPTTADGTRIIGRCHPR